jgi:hypothetical protein
VFGELQALLTSVTDANRCFLGSEEQIVVSSVMRAFPDDLVSLLQARRRPLRPIELPLHLEVGDDGRIS